MYMQLSCFHILMRSLNFFSRPKRWHIKPYKAGRLQNSGFCFSQNRICKALYFRAKRVRPHTPVGPMSLPSLTLRAFFLLLKVRPDECKMLFAKLVQHSGFFICQSQSYAKKIRSKMWLECIRPSNKQLLIIDQGDCIAVSFLKG